MGKDHIVLGAVQREQKSQLCHGDLLVLSPLTDCAPVAPLVYLSLSPVQGHIQPKWLLGSHPVLPSSGCHTPLALQKRKAASLSSGER